MRADKSVSFKGPPVYENWRKEREKAQLIRIYEYPLFTDTPITGELLENYCPYKILNPVRMDKNRVDVPELFLRLELYIEDSADFPEKIITDVRRYHGGYLEDEIAALISLCLGVRLKAGGITREFKPQGDPKGLPRSYDFSKNPVLLKPATISLPVLPRMSKHQSIDRTILFTRLLDLSPADANALVLSARLYQDGVWIAESEPALSWLMLVSAIEAAANHWRAGKESPEDQLRESKPDLLPILNKYGDDKLIAEVAKCISDQLGATKKFKDFIVEFLPDPPKHRPPENFRLSWKKEDLKKALGKVYSWRSKALHAGTPFPAPMCQAPRPIERNGAPIEIPLGLATQTKGGIWTKEDTPMLLHIFEYIVCEALVKWWKSMLSENASKGKKSVQ